MLFSELSKQNRVTVDGESMTGQEYSTEVLNSLCNTVIETEDAVAFAAVLRELKIPSATANRFVRLVSTLVSTKEGSFYTRFIEKLCALIPEMEPQEVPPLVYQILFLCDQSDHLLPLQRLAAYFSDKLKRFGQTDAEVSRRGECSMDIDSDVIGNSTNVFHSNEMITYVCSN